MKKFILLYFVLTIFICRIYSQYSLPFDEVTKTHIEKYIEGLVGPQCIGGIVYDDNTFENGYGLNSGYGIGKYVMKITPPVYPYLINQVCLGLTRTSAGSANWTFDIVVFDTTGTGGAPGNLIAVISNQTAVNVPIWPTVTFFDFTNITTIPSLTSGSYYVGISWDPATMPSHYIGADESTTTPPKAIYRYLQGSWSPMGGKALGVRVDGAALLTHNIAVGPFLSLPTLFNVGTSKFIKAKIWNQGTSNETGIPLKFFVDGVQIGSINMNLNAGGIDSVSFNWTPSDTGTKNIRIVSGLANDEYRGNDTVSTYVTVWPQGILVPCYGTGSAAVSYPFYTFYMDSKTDMLYTANEIGTGPMTILKIGYNIVYASPQEMNGFRLRIQNTTLTSLTGFTQTGWTDAYVGTYSITSPGLKWITLTSPFTYTGGNLLIEICFNNSSYTSSSTVSSTANSGRVIHNHADLPTSDGCVDITIGTVHATLPNICLAASMVGVNNGNTEIPNKFSLSQNYPNPFNPKTIITYSIPPSKGAQGVTDVKLTLFDALGREVAVLVNEKQGPGNYSVEWDGTNYSSGLYFYKLECEGFSDVKKMVLIK